MGAKELKRPNIYGYHDYREFLKDWFAFLKDTKRGFSMRSLALRAGLATGYLPMVLKGERKLTEKTLDKLDPYLGLNQQDAEFLRLLCHFDQAISPSEQSHTLAKMQNVKAYSASNEKEYEAYKYLSHWYYVAIREMVNLPGFRKDPEWIQKRFWQKVPRSQIHQALNFLVQQNFIEFQGKEQARQTKKDINCMGGIFKIALAQFHKEMLSLAIASVDHVRKDDRFILGHTLSLSKESFDEAKKILLDAQEKLAKLEVENQGTNIFHFTLCGIPLTQEPEE